MNGLFQGRVTLAIAVVAVFTMLSPASAEVLFPLPSTDATDTGSLAEDAGPGAYYASTSTSASGETDLAKQIAELKAWQAKVEAADAALEKKKAAAPILKIGGRIFADTAMFTQNPASMTQVGDVENGTEMRAAWLAFSGSAFHVIDYKLQFDIAGQTSFKDAFVQINELPVLKHVRIGHFKEPFGMEQLEASKFTTFMERSLGDAGVFVPARNMGVMAHDCTDNERMTWAIGAFASEQGDKPPQTQEDRGGTALTLRTTFLPWYDEASEGRGLLHTGFAYSYRAVADETLQLRARPEAHLGPYIVDTGTLDVSDWQVFGAELAYLYGPFSVQSELYYANLNMIGAPNAELNGYYAYVSYFLTGENRRYKRNLGAFGNRVKPFENFFRVRGEDGCAITGKGAWELAYRYSYVDLNDGTVAGGIANGHTFGLNWYLTPYTRMMFNYVHSNADRGGVDNGTIDIVEMRAQVDF